MFEANATNLWQMPKSDNAKILSASASLFRIQSDFGLALTNEMSTSRQGTVRLQWTPRRPVDSGRRHQSATLTLIKPHSLSLIGSVSSHPDYRARESINNTSCRHGSIHTRAGFSEEETLIQELNALRQFEILAQTEENLVNPGIKHGDKVLVTQGPLKCLETEVVRREDKKNAIVINITILKKTIEYPVSADKLRIITS